MSDSSAIAELKFFGAVTASVSHELKNRLAIINEQAGLLKDLVHMAERGRPLDPERLERLSEGVAKQVALGDDLLRHMNRFAHSVDAAEGPTDVAGAMACVAALARRNADRRQVKLEVRTAEVPLSANMPAYGLMQVLWTLLEAAMGADGQPRTLTLSCDALGQHARIRIAGAAAGDAMTAALSAVSDAARGLVATMMTDPPAVDLQLPG